jgi:hypothetical protein
MATINVTLPADGDTIDASDYNVPVNTIVNEINGNLDNSNISAAAAISGSKLANASVTPAKRSGGFYVGTFANSGTSNIVVTGLGFTPKFIQFFWLASNNTGLAGGGYGAADGTSQFAHCDRTASGSFRRENATDACIMAMGSGGVIIKGALSSLDADGFTITVSTGSSNETFGYIAYA